MKGLFFKVSADLFIVYHSHKGQLVLGNGAWFSNDKDDLTYWHLGEMRGIVNKSISSQEREEGESDPPTFTRGFITLGYATGMCVMSVYESGWMD